jgi:hypothetical protein
VADQVSLVPSQTFDVELKDADLGSSHGLVLRKTQVPRICSKWEAMGMLLDSEVADSNDDVDVGGEVEVVEIKVLSFAM